MMFAPGKHIHTQGFRDSRLKTLLLKSVLILHTICFGLSLFYVFLMNIHHVNAWESGVIVSHYVGAVARSRSPASGTG